MSRLAKHPWQAVASVLRNVAPWLRPSRLAYFEKRARETGDTEALLAIKDYQRESRKISPSLNLDQEP